MPFSNTEIRILCQDNTLSGWSLGLWPPDKRRRIVFLPGKAKCAACGCSITDLEWRLYQTCTFWKCRTQHRRQQRTFRKKDNKRNRRQRKTFERRVRLLRDTAAGFLNIDRPERFVSAVVPAIQRSLTCLPKERKSLLGNNLRKLIAETHEKPDVSSGACLDDRTLAIDLYADSPSSCITQAACAMCRGSCCINGGNSAYLTQETISRYLSKHPEIGSCEVYAMFLSYVEERTIENSCIFHGEDGCSLPRDARSATCNHFECAGLRRLLKKSPGPGPHQMFLVATEKNQVVRYAFVREIGKI